MRSPKHLVLAALSLALVLALPHGALSAPETAKPFKARLNIDGNKKPIQASLVRLVVMSNTDNAPQCSTTTEPTVGGGTITTTKSGGTTTETISYPGGRTRTTTTSPDGTTTTTDTIPDGEGGSTTTTTTTKPDEK